MPMPRKLSVASVMTAMARLIVATTRTGAMTLGKICGTTIAEGWAGQRAAAT